MAKKRFTADLFGLFEDPEPIFQEDTKPARTSEVPAEESVEVEVPVKTEKAKRKLSSKKFTSNLDAFLTQDMERANGNTVSTNSPKSRTSAPAAAPRKRRKTGLDLLIRSTISKEEMEERNKPAVKDTKRVTLVFNKNHLVTLKEQAKERNMYLKDVVQEMVSNYLAENE